MKSRQGFTLIELIVIITVIAVLATITTLGLLAYQKQARDTQRQSSVTVIVEALENYYQQNGEYPGCSALTGSASAVANGLKIDAAVLKAPVASADNSFICSELAVGSSTDQYAYVGDGSASCQSGAACLEWTIQYRSEETGEIVSVKSRHTTNLATSGDLNLTATVASDTAVNLTWNAVPNTVSYQVERSRSASMSSPTTSTTTSLASAVSGLGAGTKYYFRVTPLQGSQTGSPGLANATTTISAPTGAISTGSSLQSSNTIARGSASGGTCPAGTTRQYTIGYDERNQATAVSISYPAWGTGTSRDISAAQGYNYTFQTKARCVGPDATSGEVASSQTNVTRPINQPAAPNYTGDTTFAAGYRYMMSWSNSCPAGTSLVTGSVRAYTAGFGGNSGANVVPGGGGSYAAPTPEWWYLGWAAGQVDITIYYYSYYSCQTAFTTSAQSPTRTSSIYVYCEAGRRSYSASPRCDSTGQNPATLPWGP